ncbi:MAG: hypothetical protein EYC70_12030 [Planctomycetota bacterium]|nr:MAG: hypothetical protein EYC70_12030 [Planctomycetota bacterium]
MRTLLVLLGLALILGLCLSAPATAAPSAIICVTATDNYGYTWTLSINTQTKTITGTWDTSLVGCPVYAASGTYTGTSFTITVTQNVTTGCDTQGTFVGVVDVATRSATGTYVGNFSGGPYAWSWAAARC